MELEGAIVLVTGGARGLGLAIATHLQQKGALVHVADLDAASLASLPASMQAHVVDVTDPVQASAVAKAIVATHGRIDVLVNNAGVIFNEPMINIMNAASGMMHDLERFRKSMAVNFESVFIMTSAVVEQMVLRRTKGVVVNISSISAVGNEGQTAYSAAKAGVNAMTVTWSKEFGRMGIRCNAVAPGFIDTDSTKHALDESIVKHLKSNTPLRRLGRAEEVAQGVASVITNDFINGVILDVNGGLRI